jgi:uncharacterized protein (TIGR00251 family)
MGANRAQRWEGDTLVLELRVQPRASRDELLDSEGGRLKVRVTSPPSDGQANAHLVRFLAALFRVPKRDVTILAGESSRNKRVAIRAPRVLPDPISART